MPASRTARPSSGCRESESQHQVSSEPVASGVEVRTNSHQVANSAWPCIRWDVSIARLAANISQARRLGRISSSGKILGSPASERPRLDEPGELRSVASEAAGVWFTAGDQQG